MSAGAGVSVREVLTLLQRWQARLLAGEQGLGRSVTWATTMRARLPAFEGLQGGELALISLATLHSLRARSASLSLSSVIDQLAGLGVAAVVVVQSASARGGPEDPEELDDARLHADRHALPLIQLAAQTSLIPVERAVIGHVVARRDAPAIASPLNSFALELQSSLRAEALDALLSGTYAGEAQMRARASQFGYDLAQPHAVLVVEVAGVANAAVDSSPPPAITHVREALERTLGAWARAQGTQVVCVLPVGTRNERDLAAECERVLTRSLAPPGSRARAGLSFGATAVEGAPECVWSAGLGGVGSSPAQMRRSAVEARDAERLGRGILGPCRVALLADLGVYRLLLALRDTGELVPFVEQTLGPLLGESRGAESLVETLDVYFECAGNLSEAARRLHLHRNSLLYRLHRALDLLGRDIDDSDFRLALQLAIKGQRVLKL